MNQNLSRNTRGSLHVRVVLFSAFTRFLDNIIHDEKNTRLIFLVPGYNLARLNFEIIVGLRTVNLDQNEIFVRLLYQCIMLCHLNENNSL